MGDRCGGEASVLIHPSHPFLASLGATEACIARVREIENQCIYYTYIHITAQPFLGPYGEFLLGLGRREDPDWTCSGPAL